MFEQMLHLLVLLSTILRSTDVDDGQAAPPVLASYLSQQTFPSLSI
jgi:hypothetical protein